MPSTGEHSEMTQLYMSMCEVQLTAHCEICLHKEEKKKKTHRGSPTVESTLRQHLEKMHGHSYTPIDAFYKQPSLSIMIKTSYIKKKGEKDGGVP